MLCPLGREDGRVKFPVKIDTADFVRSALSKRQFLKDGKPQVAFAGRSNVGKSSLLNRLLGRKGLARISKTPGRTRAVNYFLVNGRVYFVDLPGYGYAKAGKKDRAAWAKLIDAYCASALRDGLVVLLVDSKVGATELDCQAFEYLSGFGGEVVVVATKTDRLSGNRRGAALRGIRETLELGEETDLIPVSAKSGAGVKELWHCIELHVQSAKKRMA